MEAQGRIGRNSIVVLSGQGPWMGHEAEVSESPWVNISEQAIGEAQLPVAVQGALLLDRGIGPAIGQCVVLILVGAPTQVSRHAQMNQEPVPIETNDNGLGPSSHDMNALTNQGLKDLGIAIEAPQGQATATDRLDSLAHEVRSQLLDKNLDFGQLWHWAF
jgi:hypothetical protein